MCPFFARDRVQNEERNLYPSNRDLETAKKDPKKHQKRDLECAVCPFFELDLVRCEDKAPVAALMSRPIYVPYVCCGVYTVCCGV